MENIFLPSKIELQEGQNPNEGILIVEPLYHGYGTTIGNTLRRVLLSSLVGAAVTSVKIKGITHEFSAIPGIHEDVLELVLNLKQLRLKLFTDEPVVLKLVKKGIGDVLAEDISKNSDVQIINPDLKIATITDKSITLDMELIVEKGRGFDPTENRDKSKLSVGSIAIDAIYTPIKDVGYKVELTRVGQITNYDKLILNIETDGTISPQEALNIAAKILIDHYSLVIKEVPIVQAKISDQGEKKAKIKTAKKTAKKTSKKSKK
jgi:DNA-directed RNA polymerase subunit alpha